MLVLVAVQYIFNRGNANDCSWKFVHIIRLYVHTIVNRNSIDEMLYDFTETFFRVSSIGNGLRAIRLIPSHAAIVPMSSRGFFVHVAQSPRNEHWYSTRVRFTRPIEFLPRARHGCAHSTGKRTAKLYTVKLKSAHVRAWLDGCARRRRRCVCRCVSAGRTRRVNHHQLLSCFTSYRVPRRFKTLTILIITYCEVDPCPFSLSFPTQPSPASISVRRAAYLLLLTARAKLCLGRWRALSNSLSSAPQAAEEKGDEGTWQSSEVKNCLNCRLTVSRRG